MRIAISILFIFTAAAFEMEAACSLDHLLICSNPDGDPNTTQDNNTLFFDCTQKYRNTPSSWQQSYYTLAKTFWNDYRLSEPGVDVAASGTQAITGVKNSDYRIMLECLSISPGLLVLYGTDVVISDVGDLFNHSAQSDNHVHLTYYAPNAAAASSLQWVTLRLYDAMGRYNPSEPITIIFGAEPLPGDTVVDGVIDSLDAAQFCSKWLMNESSVKNDFYERCDVNHDGAVDLLDFAAIYREYGRQSF